MNPRPRIRLLCVMLTIEQIVINTFPSFYIVDYLAIILILCTVRYMNVMSHKIPLRQFNKTATDGPSL